MDFYIIKEATLPNIKMKFTYGNNVDFEKLSDMLDNCAVTFSMINVDNKTFKIANRPAHMIKEENKSGTFNEPHNYYLQYNWDTNDTNKVGTFMGEFVVDFLGDYCGKMKLPVNEKLYIHIADSITRTDVI